MNEAADRIGKALWARRPIQLQLELQLRSGQDHTAEVYQQVRRVGRLGLEPRTHGLKVRCSTIELTPREN